MLYTQLLYFTPGPHSVKATIAALVSDGARPASVQLLFKLVNLYSGYSKTTERGLTEKYVLGLVFEDGIL